MRDFGGRLLSVIAAVLVVILGFVSFRQHLVQPRYQLPGRAYVVKKTYKNNPQVNAAAPNQQGQPGQQPGQQSGQNQTTTEYYVFDKNRDQGHVIVTSDKKTAIKALKNSDSFDSVYQNQSNDKVPNSGTTWTYDANHHGFTVMSAPTSDQSHTTNNLHAKKIKVKHGKVIGHIVDDTANGQSETVKMQRLDVKK